MNQTTSINREERNTVLGIILGAWRDIGYLQSERASQQLNAQNHSVHLKGLTATEIWWTKNI